MSLTKEQLSNIEASIKAYIDANRDDEDVEWLIDEVGEDAVDIFMLAGREDLEDLFKPDIELIKSGRTAGDGSPAYMAFKHVPTDQIFGFTGWYSSYDGYNWNKELQGLTPFTVTHYH